MDLILSYAAVLFFDLAHDYLLAPLPIEGKLLITTSLHADLVDGPRRGTGKEEGSMPVVTTEKMGIIQLLYYILTVLYPIYNLEQFTGSKVKSLEQHCTFYCLVSALQHQIARQQYHFSVGQSS